MVAELQDEGSWGAGRRSRIARVSSHGVDDLVDRLVDVSQTGLGLAYDRSAQQFPQTMRRTGEVAAFVRREGASLRYSAIAALGLDRLDKAAQAEVLAGQTAADLARTVGLRALHHTDPGALALAAWAIAEVCGSVDEALFARLDRVLSTGAPIPTVDLSWILTASVAAGLPIEGLASAASSRLLNSQGDHGIFPHVVPAAAHNIVRRHVGSFADQVYPMQALARLYRVTGDPVLLAAAEATAHRICALQGPAGQWWWHYDVRSGQVVERFPVYSVHQHAMAPMTLFDVAEAGGADRTPEIVRGLRWIQDHPEVDADLVSDSMGAIWRKVGRHEPPKAARRISAVTTAIKPGLHVPGLDRIFPANRVDHECRPYELGWLLYAWLPQRGGADRG